jgi:aldehyde:ferredoxin oxidoreductase
VLDSLIWCKFLRKAFDDLYAESAVIYEHITGWPMTAEELRQAGERINNLKKLFNIREGWQRGDDTLPPRVLSESLPTGIVQGVGLTQVDLDLMIQGYYTARGWTAEGLIPAQKLRELDLLESIKKLGVTPPGALPPAAELDTSVGTLPRVPDADALRVWSTAFAGVCRSVY